MAMTQHDEEATSFKRLLLVFPQPAVVSQSGFHPAAERIEVGRILCECGNEEIDGQFAPTIKSLKTQFKTKRAQRV